MSTLTLRPILDFVLHERGLAQDPRLLHLATWLPDIPCAGVELLLLDEPGHDLQQRVRVGPELNALKRHLESVTRTEKLAAESTWSWLLDRIEHGAFDAPVKELWLELDQNGNTPPPLSVFVRMGDTTASQNDVWLSWLQSVRYPLGDTQAQALQRCISACISERVDLLGLMLGRPDQPLRLIVDQLGAREFGAYLDRAGWSGDVARLQATVDELFGYFERIRLGVGISDHLEPTIALECFLGPPEAHDRRWQAVLDELCRRGLCGLERRNQLLGWSAHITPATSRMPWPWSLLRDALIRSPQEIGWLDCRLSHLKFRYSEHTGLRGKGYIGFVDTWRSADTAATSLSEFASSRSTMEAISAAENFLLSAQSQAGNWVDYAGFIEGASDEWVTGYVAGALCSSHSASGRHAAQRAWTWLERRPRDGWGWNLLQPADADSTVWALRLASQLEIESPRTAIAREFLCAHLHCDGGFATYTRQNRATAVHASMGNPDWWRSHVCVTAAAASLVHYWHHCCEYLRQTQHPDGHWHGYWWSSDAYATAMAAQAFALHGTSADATRVTKASDWVRAQRQKRDGESESRAFEEACHLLTFIAASAPVTSQKEIIDSLLRQQLVDGSWISSARMVIPNAAGRCVDALDNYRTLTTATVLSALSAARDIT